jgi:hypothetical protein
MTHLRYEEPVWLTGSGSKHEPLYGRVQIATPGP